MEKTRVLIVEDDSIIAADLRATLEALGYEVTGVAHSGEDGIKKASETRPDIVLMDIVLKGQIDGIKAAGLIFKSFSIPVVYLTSHSDKATLKRALETGPFGYILKPYEEKDMRATIEMALYKHNIEARLKASEKWLSVMLKSIGDAVIATNAAGKVEYINMAAERLTGYSLKEAAALTFNEVFCVRDENSGAPITDILDRAVSGKGVEREMVLVSKDEREIPIESNATPILDEEDRIIGYVIISRDITPRKRAEEEKKLLIEELRRLSAIDGLTGLYNRRALMETLEREVVRAARYDAGLSLIICDLDFFKEINDTHGHTVGDRALVMVSEAFREEARKVDILGRYGGDEFMIVLPETSLDGARDFAERLRRRVSEMKLVPRLKSTKMSLSIGVTCYRKDGDTLDAFVKRADDALYVSKREGRNRVSYV